MKQDITDNNKISNNRFDESNELDIFIMHNRDSFEEELPLGHLERFNRRIALKNSNKSKVRRFTISFSAVAAAVILGVIAFTQIESNNTAQDENYEFMYYKAQIESVKDEIFNESSQIGGAIETEAKGTVYSIMNESIPLEQLLPEELTKAQKDTILKKYYKKKLKGLNQYKSIVSQERNNYR